MAPTVQESFEPKTWRELLHILLESPSMKEQLVKTSGLHAATLDRWVRGLNKPRPETLRALVLASGSYQESFLKLIRLEHPTFTLSEQPAITLKREAIELSLYRDTMKAVSHTPASQRYWTVQNLILDHMLAVLAPTCTGIGFSINQCLQSRNQVLCLRSIIRRATPPWSDDYSPRLLLGSESLSGYAVTTRRPAICQNMHENEGTYFPLRQESDELEESVAAFPILSELKVAGCLVINCMNTHFFSEERRQQIEAWVDLLSLGFPPEDYFEYKDIALKKMPPHDIQEKHFATLQERIFSMRLHTQAGKRLTQMQAEKQAWQQIADELTQSATESFSQKS